MDFPRSRLSDGRNEHGWERERTTFTATATAVAPHAGGARHLLAPNLTTATPSAGGPPPHLLDGADACPLDDCAHLPRHDKTLAKGKGVAASHHGAGQAS
jgi:hypothetical protein